MDQACAFGSVPVLMTYDGDVLHVEGATVAAPLHLVLVDLAASKDTVIILEQLQVGVGVDVGVRGGGVVGRGGQVGQALQAEPGREVVASGLQGEGVSGLCWQSRGRSSAGAGGARRPLPPESVHIVCCSAG